MITWSTIVFYMQELRVMKVKQSGGTKCYIAVLNSSNSALPQAVLNASATVSSCSDLNNKA